MLGWLQQIIGRQQQAQVTVATDAPKVMIWGESLVGSGHHRIMCNLAIELEKLGFQPLIVTGTGEKMAHFEKGGAQEIKLPTISRKDASMPSVYITESGKHPSEDTDWQNARKAALLEVFYAHKPAIVITELWPQERGILFDNELLPLMEAAKNAAWKPMVFSIARDITFHANGEGGARLDSNGLASFATSATVASRYCNAVFARCDGSVALDPRFTDGLTIPVHYPGYFVLPLPPKNSEISQERRPIIVTAGGGDLDEGRALYRNVLKAYAHLDDKAKNSNWLLLMPDGAPENFFKEIESEAANTSNKIAVVRNINNYLDVLVNAQLLIGLAGMNTAVEAIEAHVPYLAIPIDNPEQIKRVEIWSKAGLCGMISGTESQNPEALAGKIIATKEIFDNGVPELTIKIGGAEGTAKEINRLYLERLKDGSPLAETREVAKAQKTKRE